MKIINKEICNQIKAEEGYVIAWDGMYVRTINVPFTRDIQEIYKDCEEITIEEQEARQAEEEAAAAALEEEEVNE